MRDSRHMEFWITIIGLARRTRVIIPACLIAVALGAAAYWITPTTYESSTTMVLTTTKYGGTLSRDPTKPTDLTNPLLDFNDSMNTTSAIFVAAMNTKEVDRQLGATGSTQLVVNQGETNPDLIGLTGPFLYIVGKSTSPDEAKRIVLDAQTLAREKLRDWQRALNAPETTYVSLADVVPPSAPQPDRARATKYALLGFIFGFALSLGIDYLSHQRRRRGLVRDAAQVAGTGALPPDDRPRPDPHPSSALTPTGVAEVDVDAHSAPVATPPRGRPEPTAEATDLNGEAAPAVPSSRNKKDQPVPLPVPEKLKTRSRKS